MLKLLTSLGIELAFPELAQVERRSSADFVADDVARLERRSTAGLSNAALRGLTHLNIEVLGVAPLDGDQVPTIVIVDNPPPDTTK